MPDRWTEEMLDHAPRARSQFRDELRRDVIEAWGEADASRGGSGHSRPRWIAAAVAAAVAAMVGAGIAVLVVHDDPIAPSSPADTTTVTRSTASRAMSRADIVGTWVVTERSQLVDPGGPRALLPMGAPLPTYRFGDDGVVSGFDGCNGTVANWSFEDGRFDRGGEGPSGTGGSTAVLCSTADGEPIPTIGPFPVRLEESNGLLIMVFEQDGEVAHAYRLRDLPTPESIAGSWLLPRDGTDATIELGEDGSVTVGESGSSPCARGTYTFEAGALSVDVTTTSACPSDIVSSGTFQVVLFSDSYAADTPLLVPPDGGAIRLYSSSGFSVTSSADPAPETTTDLSAVEPRRTRAKCVGVSPAELVSGDDRVTMDVISFTEMTETCSRHGDGDPIADSTFRPSRALAVTGGNLAIATATPGDTSVDVRRLRPRLRLADIMPSADVLARATDGTYPISLPGEGCFVVTVRWRADGLDGHFTSLAETAPRKCDADGHDEG